MTDKNNLARQISPFLSLKPSPERFETVLKSISDGVMSIDHELRITCFNVALSDITGIPKNEALGKKCSEVFKQSCRHDGCWMKKTLLNGSQFKQQVMHLMHRDGREIPVSVSVSPIRDDDDTIIGAVQTFRDLSELQELRKELYHHYSFHDIISKNERMHEIFSLLKSIAPNDSTVLIEGESGTGKELIARAIHFESNRAQNNLVVINCGAIPDSLLESELFGYKVGAFTGAIKTKIGKLSTAHGGTLFFDEIGEIPLSLQVKLLRVIQEKTFEPLGSLTSVSLNTRFVVATNKSLRDMVMKGEFREDLYYRLNVIHLKLPPLRERKDDIPLLINHFVRHYATTMSKDIHNISSDALAILMNYSFPGNIRELRNIIEHGVVLAKGGLIQKHDLPLRLYNDETDESPQNLQEMLEKHESQIIRHALLQHNWNRLQTARFLGIHKATLFRRIKKLGIELPEIDGRYNKE